ncbi:unnamed protein product [Rhizoctonia solani]|uniref:Uncharacterized protein n=1 Tax=Rhizoctonia solani TaxID=456999 RepID=A0A8H3DJA8_9AGAM|nr:unnamed protein product [Rhizoctonia solani]
MSRDSESPYPANAVFGVHKGFKPGSYPDYRTFLAQTEGYPGGKEVWAVFSDIQHATEYARTGRCPVTPIFEKKANDIAPPPGSGRSLPTPDTSPETENVPHALPTRQRPSTSAPLAASASQPPPAAPRKPQAIKPDSDDDGDTEPEDEYVPPSSSLPAPTTKTPQKSLPRRPFKAGSITSALKRHASLNGGAQPSTQDPLPAENATPAPTELVLPSTAPAASGSGPSRKTHRNPPTASGSGLRTFPTKTPAPVPAPFAAPVIASTPALVPELPRQARPHGTYEQCHHCDGKGWLITPAQPTSTIPPSQPLVVQTPSRPRATPTTNLRILSTASESEGATGSATYKTRTPSGSRLRVSSIGGVGPERTPRRDPKRSVSDTVSARRLRATSDGVKDKGKGKGRAVEPMDVDTTESEAGPSAYNYL